MKYTENDIKVGTKIICKDNDDLRWWKKDKVYEVVESKLSKEIICVIDEGGSERYSRGIIDRLNGDSRVKFELIKEENKMQDLKVGDLVEVLENKSFAFKNKFNLFEKGDRAIVKEVRKHVVRIGEYGVANLIGKSEIKKVEKNTRTNRIWKRISFTFSKINRVKKQLQYGIRKFEKTN